MIVFLFSLEAILSSPVASSLSTLPFRVLRILFQGSELVPQEGLAVHRAAMEVGAIQMVLLCLAVLSHHKPRATSHSHKLALQALSALTGRYCENLQISCIVLPKSFFQVGLHFSWVAYKNYEEQSVCQNWSLFKPRQEVPLQIVYFTPYKLFCIIISAQSVTFWEGGIWKLML